MIVHDYPNRDALAEAVADVVATALREVLSQRGVAVLTVPGGTSPGPVLRRLGRAEMQWSEVTVLPGDERWVPATDARSNERLLRECFAGTPGELAHVQPLYDGSEAPELGARNLNAAVARLLPFDVCVLGMGTDGHTASLFSDAPELADALAAPPDRPLIAMHPRSAPEARVTLSANALVGARDLHLIAIGTEKIAVLEAAARPGAIEDYPVRAVLARDDIHVHRAP